MNKMLFEFEQTGELLTPMIAYHGVHEINPILTSSQHCRLDENEIDFNNKHLTELVSFNHSHEDGDEQQQQQEDILSTFDLPVLSELNRTDSTFDGIQIEKYITQTSLTSTAMDMVDASISEDSTFYPVEDSNSSTQLWVGNQCTVASNVSDDMTVPPTPSSSSSSHVSAKKRLTAVERKLRKKNQNKTAAEKYRHKKRTEKCDLVSRHTDLKNQNQELKFQLENLTFQLEQFKQLFTDVLQIPIPSNLSQSNEKN